MKINRHTESVHMISAEAFDALYFKPQKPVLIRDMAQMYPAGRKWNIHFIKAYCSDVTVELFDNGKAGSSSSAFTKPDLKMNFGQYIDTIIRNEPSNLRVFLFNMFRKKPGLRKDFPCPYLFRGILGRMGYMFFGSKNTRVRIHQDIDMSGVILTQFHGRKRVLLVSPEYSDLLYRLPFNTYSLVDLDKPDYKKYPGLEYVEAHEYILEPGDALFIPSGYWHYITYLDSGFSVSYRRLAPDFSMKLKGLLSLVAYMPFDKLMNFIVGKKWLDIKERMAERQANKTIVKKLLQGSRYSGLERKAQDHTVFGSRLHLNH